MPPRSSKDKKAKGPPPGPDIYVALLMVSVAAMVFGCVLLGIELQNYGWAMPS